MNGQTRDRLKHFRPQHVYVESGALVVQENEPDGAGEARFDLPGEAIAIKGLRQKSLIHALSSGKCADGAFLTFDGNKVHLHLVELKSALTLDKWKQAIEQFCGMYFVASAIAHLLGHSSISSIKCYLAFSSNNINSEKSTSPILLKTLTGGKSTIGEIESWLKREVPLPFDKAPLITALRTAGNADFGSVS